MTELHGVGAAGPILWIDPAERAAIVVGEEDLATRQPAATRRVLHACDGLCRAAAHADDAQLAGGDERDALVIGGEAGHAGGAVGTRDRAYAATAQALPPELRLLTHGRFVDDERAVVRHGQLARGAFQPHRRGGLQAHVTRLVAGVEKCPASDSARHQRRSNERERQRARSRPARCRLCPGACRGGRRRGRIDQGIGERLGTREPVGRELLECAQDGVVHTLGHRLPLRAHAARCLREDTGDDRLHRRAGERCLAHQHLVGHRGKRIHVASRVDRALAHGLLGAHVLRRAETQAGLRHALTAGSLHGERDAEVGHQRVSALQQDVLGLDVAVDHAESVRMLQRVGHLARDQQCLVHSELAIPLEPRAQRLARHQRHHVVEQPVDLARVQQRQDVRVLEPCGGANLGQEPLAAERRTEVGVQHLDRDVTLVTQVVGEVDRGHAALAEFTAHAVPVSEACREAGGHVVHRRQAVPSPHWGPVPTSQGFTESAVLHPCIAPAHQEAARAGQAAGIRNSSHPALRNTLIRASTPEPPLFVSHRSRFGSVITAQG